MNFQLNEEQRLIRDMVRDFASTEIAPLAAEIDRTREFPMESFRKCADLNLTGMMVSEDMLGQPGQRSRKPIANYNDDAYYRQVKKEMGGLVLEPVSFSFEVTEFYFVEVFVTWDTR